MHELGLPAALLRVDDLRKHDVGWNFALFSYLMLRSPGLRTSEHAKEMLEACVSSSVCVRESSGVRVCVCVCVRERERGMYVYIRGMYVYI